MRDNTLNDYSTLFHQIDDNGYQLLNNENNNILTIPKNKTEISKNICYYARHLETVRFEEGSQLLRINSHTFENSTINYIKIPPSVKEISNFAFANCSNLKFIEFLEPSHILVFHNILYNSSISKINIPSSLVEIKDSWCCEVKNLIDIQVSPQNHYFLFHNNNFLFGKLMKNSIVFDVLIFSRRNIRNVIIPSYIKRINPNAFKHCKKISHIKFEKDSKLSLIGENAFSESSIKEINIPKNVSIIDKFAFHKCKNLARVHFEYDSKLSKISDNAFAETSIQKIQIPSQTTVIGRNAFFKCSKLKQINILDDSNLIVIERNAFDYSSIISFIVTSKVDFIEEEAFANCQNLQIIEFQGNNFFDLYDDKIFQNTSQVIITIPVNKNEYF